MRDLNLNPDAVAGWQSISGAGGRYNGMARQAISDSQCVTHTNPDDCNPAAHRLLEIAAQRTSDPCYCAGPWRSDDSAHDALPESTLQREHARGSEGCER